MTLCYFRTGRDPGICSVYAAGPVRSRSKVRPPACAYLGLAQNCYF